LNIALATIFYNNKRELERQINSIPSGGSITHYFGIDGIFQYNFGKDGNKTGLSNDGSRELIQSLEEKGVKVVIDDCPNEIEFTKRNRYLELCEKYNIDIMIIVDSDEYFYYYDKDPLEQWAKFRLEMAKLIKINPNQNVYAIRTILAEDYAFMEYFRVWYRPGDMRYFRNSHYHYLNMKNGEYEAHKDQKIMHTQQAIATIQSLMLRHNHALVTPDQFKLKKDYQFYLINFETLVQKNTPVETADQIARMYPYPQNRDYDTIGSCACDSCTPPQPKYDSSKVIKKRF
jgi:hypothetical protein